MTTPPTFKDFMVVFKRLANTEVDMKLRELFEKNEKAVGDHFESCRPEEEWMQKYKPSGLAAEWHGPGFHKGFRQFDVIDDGSKGESDVWVWKAIAGDHGDCSFWDAHHEVFNYEIGK